MSYIWTPLAAVSQQVNLPPPRLPAAARSSQGDDTLQNNDREMNSIV